MSKGVINNYLLKKLEFDIKEIVLLKNVIKYVSSRIETFSSSLLEKYVPGIVSYYQNPIDTQ